MARSELLGQDRFGNRYYAFDVLPGLVVERFVPVCQLGSSSGGEGYAALALEERKDDVKANKFTAVLGAGTTLTDITETTVLKCVIMLADDAAATRADRDGHGREQPRQGALDGVRYCAEHGGAAQRPASLCTVAPYLGFCFKNSVPEINVNVFLFTF